MKSEHLTIFDVQERNWEWLKKNYSSLVSRFDGDYVAVFERKIVDHDKDLGWLARRGQGKIPFQPCSCRICFQGESCAGLMRMIGYFDDHFEPSAPFLRFVLRSKSLGLSYPLGVHVDTASSVTVVFDKDS